jgi:hypothetical protein
MAVAGRDPQERDGATDRAMVGHRPHVGRREHSRKRLRRGRGPYGRRSCGASRHRNRGDLYVRGPSRTSGSGQGGDEAAILPPTPRSQVQKTGSTEDSPPPTAGILSFRQVSRPAGDGSVSPGPSITSFDRHSRDRPFSDVVTSPPCRRRHHLPSPRPLHGVPEERRQGSCRFTPTAPSGRPSVGHVA